MGGQNTIPFFVTADGPVREARFKSDGGVHGLFTIAGRTDALTCPTGAMTQPDFAAEAANNNLSFRIPTPVFGAGMIENIDESHHPRQPRGFGQSAVGNRGRSQSQRQRRLHH